jgi:SAM-dependent methyltransferase
MKGDHVLDVGCGRGGDLHKWKSVGVYLWGVDPDAESIKEAQERAQNVNYRVFYDVGDIHMAGIGPYDIVCYNFSLQYIFSSEQLFKRSIADIARRVKHGGYFIGVVPDADKILKLPCKWSDPLGNTIERGPSIGRGNTGEMILVRLADGPYYAKGPVPEPLCYRNKLVEEVEAWGFCSQKWSDMLPTTTGLVSDMYSTFVFRKIVP